MSPEERKVALMLLATVLGLLAPAALAYWWGVYWVSAPLCLSALPFAMALSGMLTAAGDAHGDRMVADVHRKAEARRAARRMAS